MVLKCYVKNDNYIAIWGSIIFFLICIILYEQEDLKLKVWSINGGRKYENKIEICSDGYQNPWHAELEYK